jgi:hypothetical protein
LTHLLRPASNLIRMSLGDQLAWLMILSIPVACVSWTITHEEVFSASLANIACVNPSLPEAGLAASFSMS